MFVNNRIRSKRLSVILPQSQFENATSNLVFWEWAGSRSDATLVPGAASTRLVMMLRNHYRLWHRFLKIYNDNVCRNFLAFSKAQRLFRRVSKHRNASEKLFLIFTDLFEPRELDAMFDDCSESLQNILLYLERLYGCVGGLIVMSLAVLMTMQPDLAVVNLKS